jgi:lysyl-tRNA synthetase class 2
MASIQELKEERLKKINKLESDNIQAYPSFSKYTKTISDFLKDFNIEDLSGGEKINNTLVGRVMMSRSFGNLAFAKIFDGTASVQVVFEREVSESSINYFLESVDVADFIEVSGTNYITKKGENSLLVGDIKIISKALLPLPDKYAGLVDEEEKMRKRYLDLLLDDNKRDLFYKKAKFWKVVRNFFDEQNFLEVETPTIETTTGGAEARPFRTYHNDFDMDVYMRISIGELWQKRLMAAGFPKTFEIGRAYRNEGSSPNHLQEFTNCEFYMAYANYVDGMEMAKNLYRKIALETFGKTEFVHNGMTFDLNNEWIQIDYASEILKQTGVDINSEKSEIEKIEEIKNKLKELNVKWEGDNIERLMDTLWKYCRKSIAGPGFLINHPAITSPLAKRRKENIDTVEKFQIILAGAEVGNGYSELNDPRLQRANFEQQQKMLEGGDDEAMMPDWDYVEMLEHGMPPTCGFGFGDRLFAFLAGLPIRETVMFPLVKPK